MAISLLLNRDGMVDVCLPSAIAAVVVNFLLNLNDAMTKLHQILLSSDQNDEITYQED